MAEDLLFCHLMVPQCPYNHSSLPAPSGSRISVVKSGFFFRQSDKTRHQRFYCRECKRSFSNETFNPCFRQKKRHLNHRVLEELASAKSQRRLARNLRTTRKTIVRKFLFLEKHVEDLFNWHRNLFPKSSSIQFDDLETFEHSKLKPLSVCAAMESDTRRILGFRVARMPAKGLLVQKSLKKYGPRVDERRQMRNELFTEIKEFVIPEAEIKSDKNPHYPKDVKRHFPNAKHLRFDGRRGCVVGQGELKAGGFDELFSLNHTYAMFRANINRLFRKTWNTTKKPERLRIHILIYCVYHNLVLLKNKPGFDQLTQISGMIV